MIYYLQHQKLKSNKEKDEYKMVRDEKYIIDLINYLRKFPKETEWLEFKTNYFQAEENRMSIKKSSLIYKKIVDK